MKVEQIYEYNNEVLKQTLGEEEVSKIDTKNVVDVGQKLEDMDLYDKYVKKLINHIGKVQFDTRDYKVQVPSLLMDGWEYGSIREKIHTELPDSVVNENWTLQDGQSYDPNIFHAPNVSVKFFNHRNTYAYEMSYAKSRVKQSFSSLSQLNAFFTNIENSIKTRKTIDYDNLIMSTIGNFISATMRDAYRGTSISGSSKIRAVNLLYEYNAGPNAGQTPLTKYNCMFDTNFIKYAAYRLMLYSDRFKKASKIFSIGGQTKFTPKDYQKIIMLSEFKRAADIYLQSDTFHNELTRLPDADAVSYWQGSGTDYDFDSTSTVHNVINDPVTPNTSVEVNTSGILGVMFDKEALGITNVSDTVETNYNAKASFYNYFYKSEADYFNDYNENFVVFFVA